MCFVLVLCRFNLEVQHVTFLACDSRRHKAWGVGPRGGVSLNQAPGCGAKVEINQSNGLIIEGGVARCHGQRTLANQSWGSRPRLYAIACYRRLND